MTPPDSNTGAFHEPAGPLPHDLLLSKGFFMTRPTTSRLRLAALLLLIAFAGSAASCSSEQAQRAQDAVVQAESNLKAEQERLEAAKSAGQNVDEPMARIASLQRQLDQAKAVLASMQAPDGTLDIGAGVGAIGSALPPPWNLIALVGGPIAGFIVNEMRNKPKITRVTRAAKSIVNAIDVARTKSPAVAEGMSQHADAIRGALTEEAKAIVEAERLT